MGLWLSAVSEWDVARARILPAMALSACAGAAILAAPTGAGAAEPVPEYTVDGAQGPVTGSTRIIGLGGAFVSIAEDVDGIAKNPAAAAVRLPYSWHRWDTTFGIDFSVGGWLPHADFLNRGAAEDGTDVEQRSLLVGSLGGGLYYRHAGIGTAAQGQSQGLSRPADTAPGLAPTHLTGNFGIVHLSAAYGFFDGRLVVGAGPRIAGVSLSARSSESGVLNVGGVGYQVGAVYKPTGGQFRVGAAYKSTVTPSLDTTAQETQVAYRTTALRLPWQAAVGVAYQFGPRPLNPPLVTAEELSSTLTRRSAHSRHMAEPRKEGAAASQTPETKAEATEARAEELLYQAYLSRPRTHLLVTAELLLLGASGDSVELASYWGATSAARLRVSGQNLTVSPRLGVETEVLPHWLRLRAGGYLEPARVRGARDRIHGTFGFDVKTFSWDVFGLIGRFDEWRLSAAADAARHYLNTSFSLGFWH